MTKQLIFKTSLTITKYKSIKVRTWHLYYRRWPRGGHVRRETANTVCSVWLLTYVICGRSHGGLVEMFSKCAQNEACYLYILWFLLIFLISDSLIIDHDDDLRFALQVRLFMWRCCPLVAVGGTALFTSEEGWRVRNLQHRNPLKLCFIPPDVYHVPSPGPASGCDRVLLLFLNVIYV